MWLVFLKLQSATNSLWSHPKFKPFKRTSGINSICWDIIIIIVVGIVNLKDVVYKNWEEYGTAQESATHGVGCLLSIPTLPSPGQFFYSHWVFCHVLQKENKTNSRNTQKNRSWTCKNISVMNMIFPKQRFLYTLITYLLDVTLTFARDIWLLLRLALFCRIYGS